MGKWFEAKPQKMREKLLDDAQRRLIEAEHMESRWKHAANQAREEIQRLNAQVYAELGGNQKPASGLAGLAKQPTVAEVAKSVEEVSRRSFIGQAQT